MKKIHIAIAVMLFTVISFSFSSVAYATDITSVLTTFPLDDTLN